MAKGGGGDRHRLRGKPLPGECWQKPVKSRRGDFAEFDISVWGHFVNRNDPKSGGQKLVFAMTLRLSAPARQRKRPFVRKCPTLSWWNAGRGVGLKGSDPVNQGNPVDILGPTTLNSRAEEGKI